MRNPPYLKFFLIKYSPLYFIFLLFSNPVYAILFALEDSEMSDITGQSVIQVNQSQRGNTQYTRVDMGLDIKMNATIDKIDLGSYVRNGNSGSDILIEDLGLGYIDESGVMHPFEMIDPFIEYAVERDENGKEQLVGLRFGQAKARGVMNNEITNLSGELNVRVRDRSHNLLGSSQEASGADWVWQLLSGVLFSGSWPTRANPVLMDDNGIPTAIRATQTGVPDGQGIELYDIGLPSIGGAVAAINSILSLGGIISPISILECQNILCSEIHLKAQGCGVVLGMSDVCFPLSQSDSLNLGTDEYGQNPQYVKDQFISLSSKSVVWSTADKDVHANKGFYLYMPPGGVTLNLRDATIGTKRLRTRYTNDKYYD